MTPQHSEALAAFTAWCDKHITGDEKGEAQIFLDRFFTALGHKDGLKGAGANLEYRVRKDKRGTSFADLVWPKRAVIEMKKRGEDLDLHLQQATSYFLSLAGARGRYVVLCNFDEFWIYDFDADVYKPQDVVKLADLPKHRSSFAFLFPTESKPLFHTNREQVTTEAAKLLSDVYKSMIKRNVPPQQAMRYCLQCVLSLFAEDVDLLPEDLFTTLITECDDLGLSGPDKCPPSYDLIGGLFREMNARGITEGGRYRGVDYFNGGLFATVEPVELTGHEVSMLHGAAGKNWSAVNPSIFGSFFEGAMEAGERHKAGAHYTYEIDIKKIVDPVIVQPFREAIDHALESDAPLDALYAVLDDLRAYRVLDPACGSGNFLFVAYREMKMLEKRILVHLRELSRSRDDAKCLARFLETKPYVSTKQFFGLDIKPFAVEVARMTLMVAKELWCTENKDIFDRENALPLDNLDQNILCVDALLDGDAHRAWPEADAIIGNPPFQSKNKMQEEFGAEYVARLRAAYPDVPGRADFCVYWFRRAHDHLKPNGRAGLVGTNTIRQNYSREGSLDHIVHNGGVIYSAVSSQVWHGEAVVHVSIACWKKGAFTGQRYLFDADKDGELQRHEVDQIGSSLSVGTDVTAAKELHCNIEPKRVFQGQTHGHEGFLLERHAAEKLLKKEKRYSDVLKPFLTGDELVSEQGSQPSRFVIDFSGMDVSKAASYKSLFAHLEKHVLPEREARAIEQETENKAALKKNPKAKVNKHHIVFFNRWWQLSWGREDMLKVLRPLSRYIVTPQVTSRAMFEFLSSEIHPNAALMVFAFDDDYSFGLLQSTIHARWWRSKGSSMKSDPRYTTESVWDTFPWPQKPTQKQVEAVASAAKALREARTKAMREGKQTLRDLYRLMEKPGKNPLRELHAALDKAVLAAYGFDAKQDLLAQLLELNLTVAAKEEKGEPVQKPGLPDGIKGDFVSEDCVKYTS